ncbi:uncharacterized protein LOC132747695 isoform X3 [Ruditapes philippinarum]|nr:uncharacterized protein LOC132747695 isoform X3 [Ruditapes philippinarum]
MLKYSTLVFVVYLLQNNLVSGESLSSFLWKKTQKYQTAALDSNYIHGIRDVSLDPTDFGAYNLQDAVYIYWYKVSMDISASRTNDTTLKEFLQKKSKSHEQEYKEAFKTWHISDPPRGIVLGSACQNYVNHLINVSKTMDGFYLVAALIPCSRLWPWLGIQINSDSGKFGVYNNWVQVNLNQSYVGYTTYEKIIDDAFAQGKINKEKALQAYEESMKGEVDFFNSV